MTIHEQIKGAVKEALREKNEVKLAVSRGLLAGFTNELVAKRRKPDELLTDEEALTVIKRAARQRQDSIDQFKLGGRADLAAGESAELAFLQSYLPATMPKDEIKKVVEAKLAELGVGLNEGQLIGAIMKELHGRAEGGDVKAVVAEVLKK
jgi:uncharacterized protein YqeY